MDLKLFKTDLPCRAVFHQVRGHIRHIGHLPLLFFVFVLIVLNNDMHSSSIHVSLEITSPSICASCSPKLSLKERATSLLSRSASADFDSVAVAERQLGRPVSAADPLCWRSVFISKATRLLDLMAMRSISMMPCTYNRSWSLSKLPRLHTPSLPSHPSPRANFLKVGRSNLSFRSSLNLLSPPPPNRPLSTSNELPNG